MHAHNPSDRNYRLKLLPSAPNRRTSDGLPLRRGHPSARFDQVHRGYRETAKDELAISRDWYLMNGRNARSELVGVGAVKT